MSETTAGQVEPAHQRPRWVWWVFYVGGFGGGALIASQLLPHHNKALNLGMAVTFALVAVWFWLNPKFRSYGLNWRIVRAGMCGLTALGYAWVAFGLHWRR
jgi:hypothetical protein